MTITENEIFEALKPIEDPELHLGIVDLGLIYGADIKEEDDGALIDLRMTFTSPFCPYGPQLKASVQQTLETLPQVKQAAVNVVFTPVWDPRTMATEECKIALGLGWDEDDEDDEEDF